ncbi:DUF11 domain-containing protein [Candidatus Parcubacteria bacterium]|nr:DUF11 domain-containing protein [Candidatus Parcubacteria bacterium]
MKHLTFKQRMVAVAGILAIASAFALPAARKALAADCDTNAIIYCGADNKPTLKARMNRDGLGHTDVKTIYRNFGIDVTDAGIDGAVEGTITKDGRVLVNGVVKATNVWTAGRHNIAGSVPVGGVYMRPPSVSFRSNSLPAFVKLNAQGNFEWAIIKSCGNPVKSMNQPFGDIKKRVTNVTRDPNTKHAADTNATAIEVQRGDELRYEVTISNLGTGTMDGIRMTDTLPNGVALKSNPAMRNITKDFQPITADNFSYFTITVKVDSNVADGAYISNQACFVANKNQKGCDTAVVKVKVPKQTPPKEQPPKCEVDCEQPPKEQPPKEQPPKCEVDCEQPPKEQPPKEQPPKCEVDCVNVPPTTPPAQPPVGGGQPELPDTGVEGTAAGLMGTGALGYTVRSYLRSKRGLVDAVKGISQR